jgi:hypothetical protein
MTLGDVVGAARRGRPWSLSAWHKNRAEERDWLQSPEGLDQEEPHKGHALLPKGRITGSHKLTEEINAVYDEEMRREDQEFLKHSKRYHRRVLDGED